MLFITAMLVIHDVFVDLNVAPDFNEMTKHMESTVCKVRFPYGTSGSKQYNTVTEKV